MFFVSLSFDVNADSASPKAWYDHRINHASNTSGMSQRLKKKLLANLLHCQTTLQSLGSQRLHLRTDNKGRIVLAAFLMDIDLLHPDPAEEKSRHKLKRMIQSPNSFFMDVKCPGCLQITTVFSHAQTVVLCGNCNQMCVGSIWFCRAVY
ncbi:unnamed protein product [Durusdinium trenchii]|uniref:40S ribosomal protein S27 n=1 Tax=Durusdinium trenchii TaxID=1381693 RepID=A0ABP0NU93_9DINO